jgi:four helix bundle protein
MRYNFPHERLDAWHHACRARKEAHEYLETLRDGWGDEVRQIRKATGSVVRNLCEGASRWKPKEKIQNFEISAGEAGEAAGAVQSLLSLGLGDREAGERMLEETRATYALLHGLIRRQRR